jgi:hypothetical protein
MMALASPVIGTYLGTVAWSFQHNPPAGHIGSLRWLMWWSMWLSLAHEMCSFGKGVDNNDHQDGER